jgi:hypothetical protein
MKEVGSRGVLFWDDRRGGTGLDEKGALWVREDKREESREGEKGLERKSARLDQLDDLSKPRYSQSREEERRSSSDNDDDNIDVRETPQCNYDKMNCAIIAPVTTASPSYHYDPGPLPEEVILLIIPRPRRTRKDVAGVAGV